MEVYGNTGQVRFEYNHYAFLGQESVRAAEASECANEQDQFWQYHDTLFANQLGENLGAFSDEALLNFAVAIGLDEGDFSSCFNSGRYRNSVNSELREGQNRGVTSTPSIIINGQEFAGALPFDQIQSIIASEIQG